MDLDRFIITTFCLVDDIRIDLLGDRRLRQRGPAPKRVGEYLSLHQDKVLFACFRRHYARFFPALRQIHRTPSSGRRPCHHPYP